MIHAELGRGSTRRMTFFYGARSLADLIFADEFEALAARHGNFSWVPVLSEPAAHDAWEGERGFVHEALIRLHLERHPAPETCEYYLCGPPLMSRAVVAALEDYGVDRDAILYDDFGG
jgi:Na+-transporting NADH:ubiquinone oxidoreductase subunit F